MSIRTAILTLAALALSASALKAEEPRFGVQADLSLPSNDLSDVANLGVGFGGHGRWDFGHGHGLMARADVTLYGSKDSFSTSSFGAGADYTFHLDRTQRGVYFLAGASFLSFSTSGYGHSVSNNGMGLDLGLGYDADRHVGFQARYTTHSVSGGTYSALNLGVTYTF
jgi:hypothetical protein